MKKALFFFFYTLTTFMVKANDSLSVNTFNALELQHCANIAIDALHPAIEKEYVDTFNYHVDPFIIDVPTVFTHLKDNVFNDSSNTLTPLFEALKKSKQSGNHQTIEILHIGDSHVKGGFFTRKINWMLTARFPLIDYKVYAINGSTCYYFLKKNGIKKIANYHPQCIICSFGTNEAHDKRFKSHYHRQKLEELYQQIRQYFPNTPILMTTPPGAFWKSYSKKRGHYYYPNTNTEIVSKNIINFSHQHQLAIWDLFHICGGKDYAAYNWERAGLLKHDHIHFEPQGYWLQGELFVEAFIKSYNHYVESTNNVVKPLFNR